MKVISLPALRVPKLAYARAAKGSACYVRNFFRMGPVWQGPAQLRPLYIKTVHMKQWKSTSGNYNWIIHISLFWSLFNVKCFQETCSVCDNYFKQQPMHILRWTWPRSPFSFWKISRNQDMLTGEAIWHGGRQRQAPVDTWMSLNAGYSKCPVYSYLWGSPEAGEVFSNEIPNTHNIFK